ncbi:MAG: acetyl-CoA carboxylase biotin carboxyl carrier protein [Lachnospiraceae bacterium]|nr:acetyl-CoA carboxylase biotin carboxyl carrier protein [Lachnospiraceae bacterium]
MDANNIRNYASLMKEMGLTALEINENGSTVRLERTMQATTPVAPQVIALDAVSSAVTTGLTMAGNEATTASVSDSSNNAVSGLTPVTSPMVGVFYCAPSENAEPYVRVGDKVKKGDVLCIIEAMKLMNEITAECDGTIEEVCVSNGQVVDFGHIMFRINKE